MASSRSSMRRSGADRRREALRNLLLVVVTDRKRCRGDLLESCEAAVRGGATAVLLRDKDLPRGERRQFAKGLRAATARYGASLLVHTDVALAREVGADGVHFSAEDGARKVPGLLAGVSCHSEEEVEHAVSAGADYAFFGPVFPTRSHPGRRGIGWRRFFETFSRLRSRIRLVAIGGISPSRVKAFPFFNAGPRVAVVGSILGSRDPDSAAGETLAAVASRNIWWTLPEEGGDDERSLVQGFLRRMGRNPALRLGPGDDAVVLAHGGVAFATDLTVEGVHYERGTPGRAVGFKAAGRSLSDLAAVGARPIALMVGMAVPRGIGAAARARALEAGAAVAAKAVGCGIVGGDTKETRGSETLAVTAIGAVEGAPPLPRSGARSGDVLFVTGPLGGAVRGRHLRPRPRVSVGLALRRRRLATACIDLSDGLASDLHKLCRASGVGAFLDAIPIHADATRSRTNLPVHHALYDGEDYELLFSVPPEHADRIQSRGVAGVRVFRVGRVVHRDSGVVQWVHVFPRPVLDRGWVHLRAR